MPVEETEKIELKNCPSAGQECMQNTTSLSWFLNLLMVRLKAVEEKTKQIPTLWESRIWNLAIVTTIIVLNPKVQGAIAPLLGIKP